MLRRFWTKFRSIQLLSFTEKTSFILYIIFIIRLHFKTSVQRQNFDFENIMIIFLGAISIVLLARILSLLTRWNSILHRWSNFLFLFIYLCLSFYHLRSQTMLDYSVIVDNLGLAIYGESIGVIFDIFRRKDIIQLICAAGALLLIDWRFKKFSQKICWGISQIHFLGVLLVYGAILFGTNYIYEEYTSFIKTIQHYYFGDSGIEFEIPKEKYPYRRQFSYSTEEKRPHIFIITVESFNANTVEATSSNGKELTPFYNSLIKKGIYYQNFYGHSIQTAKGQLGIYCSLLPLTQKKVFTDYPDLGVRCLPHVLKDHGYVNLFFKAFSDIGFDNTGYFARRMGFDHIHGMDGHFISQKEKDKYFWGWGIQDNIFYQKFFSFIDSLRAKGEKRSIFAALTTVSNHMKFKRVPQDQRYIFPHKNSAKERYANSIRVSDEYLKTFFSELEKRKYLEDSIVLVTADHSYPWGEHGYFFSENGFYNESFKIPLVIVGKNIVAKREMKMFSQVDIAPTLLEWTGISIEAPFYGESMLSSGERPIPLIQPYDGTYLSVIVPPYKYVYRKRTKREFSYNLTLDPSEGNNIIDQMKDSPSYKIYRKKLKEILLNDFLIKNDRIWPVGI